MSTENPPEGTPENGAPDKPRRRRSAVVAASVAAAVLLAGGGGAYWAASTSSDGGGSGGPAAGGPPPLAIDGYGESGGSGPGIAPGEPDPSGVSYEAEGELPDGPDTAPVYRPQGEVGRAAAEKLARALDVPGEPRLADGSWKFGLTRDASGPTLEVAEKAPGTWTYARYGKGAGGGCTEPPVTGGGDDRGGKGEDKGGSPQRCPAPGGPPSGGEDKAVGEAEAKKAAEPVLDAIGLSDAKLEADRTLGAVRLVNAAPVLDGLPVYGWHTGLQVGPDGQLTGGSGHLAALKKGPEYPVLSAGETLERLNERSGGGRAGIGGCASAVPHKDGDMATGSQPCKPSGGVSARSAKPEPAKVVDAELGEAVHFVGGEQALVPSWLFEVEPAGAAGPKSTYTVTHPAVRPEYIAGAATPVPWEPGGSGGSAGKGKPVDIESYSVDGRTLTLRFWGGVCTDYSAAAEGSDGRVKARITGVDRDEDRVCIKIAKLFEEKVTLEKPLGDRKVVDSSDGNAVPRKK